MVLSLTTFCQVIIIFHFYFFYQKYNDYDYYWLVEDDVRFTGSWQYLFDTFANDSSDFISSYLQYQEEERDWYWWDSLESPDYIGQIRKIKSLNSVCRLSKKALHIIAKSLNNGWKGHHEVLIPTLIYNQGLTLEDFGGEGLFVHIENKGRFYDNSTMGIKPVFPTDKKNYFFHPVKQEKQRKNGDLKSNCVFIPVGHQSLHRQLLEGDAEFDLHLMIYDDSYNKFCNDTDFIFCQAGYKMDMTYNYLHCHPNLLEHYDYFFLLDDDIRITTESVNHLFHVMREFCLEIAQPSLVMSYFTYASTLHNPTCRLRYTNFVEMMMPCFSRKALRLVLSTFEKKARWRGIEHHWPILINSNHRDMAIIDEIKAVHQKPVGSWDKKSQQEFDNYLEHYGLSNEIKLFGAVLNGLSQEAVSLYDTSHCEIRNIRDGFYNGLLLRMKKNEVIPVTLFLITSSIILNDEKGIDISMGILKKVSAKGSMTSLEAEYIGKIEDIEKTLNTMPFDNCKMTEACINLNNIWESSYSADQEEGSKVLQMASRGMKLTMTIIQLLESPEEFNLKQVDYEKIK